PPAGGEGRGEGAPPPAPFRDVTAAAGIAFVHSNGATGEKLLPETMGGGVAFFDYDGDGDPDLLFVDSAGEHTGGVGAVLYRNDGPGPDGEPRFVDVTEESGLAAAVRTNPEDPFSAFYGMGVAAADYDGDGWIDLYLTAVGRNRLLRNRWGVFEDVTDQAGVAGAPGREHEWSTGAAFFDADGDGDLDLFVSNYLEWSPELDRAPEKVAERTVATADGERILTYGLPQTYRGAHPFLFLNQGDGTFREASEQAGLHVTHSGSGEPVAKALAVAPIDADRDGFTDLLIANDTTRNLFFHNRGPGEDGLPRFEEVGELWGLAYDPHGNTTGAMGVDWGHLDPSDNLSILIGNFHDEATSLYRAQGDPTFYADEAQQAGIATATRPALTFGLLLLDYDLDGRLDLLQANGHVEPDIHKIDPQQHYRQPAQLFWNTGETAPGKPLFMEVPPDQLGDLTHPIAGRGATYADLDGDRDQDLVLTQIDGPPLVLRNDQQSGHHLLRLRLRSHYPNTHALGATVEINPAIAPLRRDLRPTRAYLSQVQTDLSLALGPQALETALHQIVVTWPDGTRDSFAIGEIARSQLLEQAHCPHASVRIAE
ncbi:MAG TPA: CRTAC1 family protein, partial [Thermoanaerobaculia bacterium]|nr:CRTAC1 family protein [Thermoanaerobaculia bacterium]